MTSTQRHASLRIRCSPARGSWIITCLLRRSHLCTHQGQVVIAPVGRKHWWSVRRSSRRQHLRRSRRKENRLCRRRRPRLEKKWRGLSPPPSSSSSSTQPSPPTQWLPGDSDMIADVMWGKSASSKAEPEIIAESSLKRKITAEIRSEGFRRDRD